MKENLPPQFTFQGVTGTYSYESLHSLNEPDSWQALHLTDRELLAKLLIIRGQHLLEGGQKEALAHFEKACQVAGHCSKIHYLIGKAYASQEHNVGCLKNALDCFDQSLNISPNIENDSWIAFVRLLLRKGELLSEVGYFQAAKEKCAAYYEQHHSMPQELLAELFWLWGRCYCYAGRVYGEAVDFYEALEKYRKAESLEMDRFEFWSDYGNAHFELASLLERPDLYLDAATYYQKALKHSHDSLEVWYHLANCYTRLYETRGLKQDFEFANSCFANAVKIDEGEVKVWLEWGSLLCEYGKSNNKAEAFQESKEKFEIAQKIEPNDPRLLRLWSEALMHEGAIKEDIALLKESEKYIISSLEMQPDSAESWYLYGLCLNELGRYFCDAKYFYLAQEKFRQGLIFDKEFPYFWHGIATSNFALGEIEGNHEHLKMAAECCARSIELGGNKSMQCWNDWGVALMRLAEINEDKSYVELALEKFQSAMSLQNSVTGEDPELLYNYGCALDFLGDFYEEEEYYEKAIDALVRVLQIDPEYQHARYNLAVALAHLGELVMDVDCLQRSAEQFQLLLNHDAEDESAWYEYGIVLRQLARLVFDPVIPEKSRHYYDQAETKFIHALTLGGLQSHYALAGLYADTKRLDLAMYHLEKSQFYNVLPMVEEIMNDEYLSDLHSLSAFQEFIDRIEE